MVKEGIRACKLGSWDIDHSKVKICQVKEPMYLSAIQCLEFVKIDQVFVVSEDLDGKGEAIKVMLLKQPISSTHLKVLLGCLH